MVTDFFFNSIYGMAVHFLRPFGTVYIQVGGVLTFTDEHNCKRACQKETWAAGYVHGRYQFENGTAH
jgi:hypothetical protein